MCARKNFYLHLKNTKNSFADKTELNCGSLFCGKRHCGTDLQKGLVFHNLQSRDIEVLHKMEGGI